MSDEKPLKMYILVRRSIPLGLAVNTVGHSTLACYLKFKDHPDTQAWLASDGFKKVTCVVDDGQFESAKKVEDHVVMTERALDREETALCFRPRREWPKHFSFYQLFGSDIVKELKELKDLKAENEDLKDDLAAGGFLHFV